MDWAVQLVRVHRVNAVLDSAVLNLQARDGFVVERLLVDLDSSGARSASAALASSESQPHHSRILAPSGRFPAESHDTPHGAK